MVRGCSMKIEDHKKAKARHKGKEVKIHYDLKREQERIAVEIVGLKARREVALAQHAPPKRSRRMAAE